MVSSLAKKTLGEILALGTSHEGQYDLDSPRPDQASFDHRQAGAFFKMQWTAGQGWLCLAVVIADRNIARS